LSSGGKLEIGDVSRFRTIKNAISYCGLCGDERCSADKVMRLPLSKQRNRHIQRALVEAAKLAPRQSRELAMVYGQEKQKGNRNRGDARLSTENGRVSACRGSATERIYPCGRTPGCGSISN